MGQKAQSVTTHLDTDILLSSTTKGVQVTLLCLSCQIRPKITRLSLFHDLSRVSETPVNVPKVTLIFITHIIYYDTIFITITVYRRS